MILENPSFSELQAFGAEVCVIGAGPVGIVTALELAAKGFRVLLLESGGTRPEPAAQALSEAENLRPDNHFEPQIALARRLGGASNLWGGRCLPFDPIDFEARPWLGLEAWPIGPEELAPYLGKAVDYLGAGRAVYQADLPEVAADPAFGFTMIERWSNTPRIQHLHARELARNPGLLTALHATVLGFDHDGAGRISALALHLEGQGRGRLEVGEVVLAAGGLESTRLLLAEQARHPALFGGAGGPLGRFYMGHLTGQIADIAFSDPQLHDALDFYPDAHGSYVRRRLLPSPETQAAAGIANIAFWPVVPRIGDARHRSGPLSAVFLALSIGPLGRRLIAEPIRVKHVGEPPPSRLPHAANVLRDLPRVLGFAPRFFWQAKLSKTRLPGFFLPNPARRYGLEYHSEQLPDSESRVTLGGERDRLGLARLRIDLRFSDEDAASVLRAHDALEAWLARNRLARLEHHHPDRAARARAVLAAARDGAHQIGTIRMGSDRRSAVVDRDCRSFDLANLHVASTAVLPSSGQANPTLTAVQLGLRLVEVLAGRAR